MPANKKGKGQGSKTKPGNEEEMLMEINIEDEEDIGQAKKSKSKQIKPESQSKVKNGSKVENGSTVKTRQEQSHDPTQIYLKEIGFSPLLTAQEEIHYGRLVRKGDPAHGKND